MHNVKYDFSSVHVDVPHPIAGEIIDWGRANVSDDDIYVARTGPVLGREDEIHATVLYGIHANSPGLVPSLLLNEGPVRVRMGNVAVFTSPQRFDVLVVEVVSEDLRRLNLKLAGRVKHTDRHGRYSPHVTVAYVRKGRCREHKGLDTWSGREFTCHYAVFSPKDGFKERLSI